VLQAKGVEPWPAEVAEQIVERCAAGESAPAIAEALRLNLGPVHALVRKRGMLRSRGEAGTRSAEGGSLASVAVLSRTGRNGGSSHFPLQERWSRSVVRLAACAAADV
jgi:hypothetical protein